MKPESVSAKLLKKILSLYVLLRHGNLTPDIKYYYRNTYYCQLIQLRYFFNDYIWRKPYKIISFSGEFTHDLQYALPHAYWHHKNGTLKATKSPKLTKELYFFSENHDECFDTRTPEGNYNYDTLRTLYSHNYTLEKWARVPLKEMYKNDVYIFDKPILIIANRYNSEWGGPPISFFSLELLSFMINRLKHQYTIIYNRPSPKNITPDNSDIYDLQEFGWLKQTHPEVLLMEELYLENRGKANNYNHFQLQLYANADRFISTHGGTSALASYFGGINLILSKKGPEHYFGCFDKFYPQLSGATILHAKTDEDVKQYIETYYVDQHEFNTIETSPVYA